MTHRLATVTIGPRYCGPPGSGNGGYVAGVLAGFLAGPAEVRLAKPPPLARPLDVVALDDDSLELRDGELALASARWAEFELEVPPSPSYAQAERAAQGYAGHHRHVFPGCFVCGTERASGDGLRIHAGPTTRGAGPGAGAGTDASAAARTGAGALVGVAAPWRPDASLAGTRGRIRPEFQWAALDCPGYFAVAPDSRVMLLGSFAVRIDRTVDVDEPCVVVGWRIDGDGRKQRAGTALYGAGGDCAARALATWIEPRR
jgi:hypothetical protein